MERSETSSWATPGHEVLARLAERHERLERAADASAWRLAAAMRRRRARTAIVTGSVVVALLGLSETYAKTHGVVVASNQAGTATPPSPARQSLGASAQLLAGVARSLAADNRALAGLTGAIAATARAHAAGAPPGPGTAGSAPGTAAPPPSLAPLQLPSVNIPAVPSTPAPSIQATTGASSGASPLG